MTDPKQQLSRYNALREELETLDATIRKAPEPIRPGLLAELIAIQQQMAEIARAVDALDAPEERNVIRLRYMQGGRKRTGWSAVCVAMWGDDDDAHLRSAYRIHKRALQHLEEAGDV